jgi:hypothetical protein
VLEEGQPIPEAGVWLGPRERVTALFFFYLFDWSST